MKGAFDELANFSTPALMDEPPEYVFAPDKVKAPLPLFCKAPVPLITPDKT